MLQNIFTCSIDFATASHQPDSLSKSSRISICRSINDSNCCLSNLLQLHFCPLQPQNHQQDDQKSVSIVYLITSHKIARQIDHKILGVKVSKWITDIDLKSTKISMYHCVSLNTFNKDSSWPTTI